MGIFYHFYCQLLDISLIKKVVFYKYSVYSQLPFGLSINLLVPMSVCITITAIFPYLHICHLQCVFVPFCVRFLD